MEAANGHTGHWITNDLEMGEMTRRELAGQARGIEEHQRGIEQHTGIESCQSRHPRARRDHIGPATRAFVRLEVQRFRTGVTERAARTWSALRGRDRFASSRECPTLGAARLSTPSPSRIQHP